MRFQELGKNVRCEGRPGYESEVEQRCSGRTRPLLLFVLGCYRFRFARTWADDESTFFVAKSREDEASCSSSTDDPLSDKCI